MDQRPCECHALFLATGQRRRPFIGALGQANRFQRILYVTLPNMRMIIVLMMVLSLGNVLNAGFDQVFNLYSKQVYATGDILDTFIYRIGLIDAQFGVATAMGMFKSVVSTLFISVSYYCAYRFADYRSEERWSPYHSRYW